MDLSLIQKDILITLISLYQKNSAPIKGEEIAEVIRRNPGTVRNQMQALKAIGLVDGVPGPKGGYYPTALAYKELNLNVSGDNYEVPVYRGGAVLEGVKVSEIAFTSLCHPDVCQAMIKILGSVKIFETGDLITIGPTPVNKLILRGEVFWKDELEMSLLISIIEMISLPKSPIREYMTSPVITLLPDAPIREAIRLFHEHRIHGAPVVKDGSLLGIVTMSDIIAALDRGEQAEALVISIMTEDVVQAPPHIQLYEVIRRFKEREIGRLIVVENSVIVGILTQSDIIRVLPSL